MVQNLTIKLFDFINISTQIINKSSTKPKINKKCWNGKGNIIFGSQKLDFNIT